MKRFDIYFESMLEYEDGRYVLYSDHLTALSEAREKVVREIVEYLYGAAAGIDTWPSHMGGTVRAIASNVESRFLTATTEDTP